MGSAWLCPVQLRNNSTVFDEIWYGNYQKTSYAEFNVVSCRPNINGAPPDLHRLITVAYIT
jgi:hypothetical protein